jgi:CRP/FNR family transcriptional regulator, cyclic AMP receptor protein
MATVKFDAQEGGSARTLAFRGGASAASPSARQGRAGGPDPRARREHPVRPASRPAGPAAAASQSSSTGSTGSTGSTSSSGTIVQPIPRGKRVPLACGSGEPVTVVQSGSVALFKALPGGRSICIGILGPGDLVFHDRATAGDEVIAEALTDAVVLQEEFQRLVTVLSGSPPLIQAALSSLRRQTTELQGLVARVLSRDIALRLAATLLALGERFGKPNPDGSIAVGIPVAHKMLARMIGSNRVTVTRVMTEMRDKGMVRAPGRNQIVIDALQLKSYLAGSRSDNWLTA